MGDLGWCGRNLNGIAWDTYKKQGLVIGHEVKERKEQRN